MEIPLTLVLSDGLILETSDGFIVETFMNYLGMDYPVSAEFTKNVYTAEFTKNVFTAEVDQ